MVSVGYIVSTQLTKRLHFNMFPRLIVGFLCFTLSLCAEDKQILNQVLSRLQVLEQDNQQLLQTVSELTHKVSVLEQEPAKQHDSFVGFLAEPSTNEEYEPNTQVQFTRELYDAGSNYDTVTSTFTCPVGGYYWFSVAVTCQSRFGLDDQMFGAIYLDNSPIVRATAKGRETSDQGFNGGVAYCYQGMNVRVYAETTSSGTLRMVGSNESSFSGFLIYQGSP